MINTFKQFVGKLPTNRLSVFDYFVGLAPKGLRISVSTIKKQSVYLLFKSVDGFLYDKNIFLLTLQAPISQNGQTRSSDSSVICRQIVLVCLTILWDWRLKG